MRSMFFWMMLLGAVSTGWAQPPQARWLHLYGGVRNEYANSVIQTADGGFLIAGSSDTLVYVDSLGDVVCGSAYFVRTDSLGNTLWTRVDSGEGLANAWTVKRLSNQGFVALGSTGVLRHDGDLFLVRMDGSGNRLWTRAIGTPDSAEAGYGLDVCRDGGFILAGSIGHGDFSTQGFIVKTDSLGNTQWRLNIGDPSYSPFWDVRQTSDGGYVAAGGGKVELNHPAAHVVKLDSTGRLEWEGYYEHGPAAMQDEAYAVCEMREGGYVIGGDTYSFAGRTDFFVVRTTADGDTLWTTTFRLDTVQIRTDWEEVHAVFERPNGNIAVAGLVEFEDATGHADPGSVVAELDPSGHVLWRALYGFDSLETYGATLTSDGGMALTGIGYSSGANLGDQVGLLRLSPLDFPSASTPPPEVPASLSLASFPNPFNSNLRIEYSLPRTQNIELTISNVLGQKVATLSSGNTPAGKHSVLWSPQCGTGVFFVTLKTPSGVRTAKVLYLK